MWRSAGRCWLRPEPPPVRLHWPEGGGSRRSRRGRTERRTCRLLDRASITGSSAETPPLCADYYPLTLTTKQPAGVRYLPWLKTAGLLKTITLRGQCHGQRLGFHEPTRTISGTEHR